MTVNINNQWYPKKNIYKLNYLQGINQKFSQVWGQF